jgi:hypothetical protein
MFKITPKATFTAAVALSVPGEAVLARISVDYKHLSKKAVKAYFEGLEGKTDAEALGEIITGWDGVDQPYSREALDALIDNYPAAAGELFEAFRRELLEARQKN